MQPLLGRGINGRGVTVAIVDAYASPTIRADIQQYAARNGGAPWALGQFKQHKPDSIRLGFRDPAGGNGGNLCDEQGWYGEETLDVEAVHTMAPGAKVLYVGAASCLDNDILNAVNDIVDGHQADIISNSYGDLGEDIDPVEVRAETAVYIQAALEGIGVFFSSGDNGDEVDTTGARQTDFPASDPWVTAVGGTSLGVGRANNYLFETGWGTTRSAVTDGAWDAAAAGRAPLRRRRRHEPAVRPAELSAGRRAGRDRQPLPDGTWAGGARHRRSGRPDDRACSSARPRRSPVTRRALRRVPHRRHEPVVAVDGRDGSARRSGRRSPAWLRQPGDLPAAGAGGARCRRPGPDAQRGPRRLRQRHRRRRWPG